MSNHSASSPDPFAPSFWDTIHRTRHIPMLGDTQAHEYVEYLSLAGPFAQELRDARAVLDVGPGLGAFLRSLPTHVARYAIEISAENRVKLLDDRVASWTPGELSQHPVPIADLATCVSVFQHCSSAMVSLLLHDVANALREGAAFYCNGIVNASTRHNTDEENMQGGCASHDLKEMSELARGAGLIVANTHSYRMSVPEIDVWVARLVKE